MMITKTNRLSMERLYSVSHPAKNSPAYCAPAASPTPIPKTMARPT
jgi:hypothetical protein